MSKRYLESVPFRRADIMLGFKIETFANADDIFSTIEHINDICVNERRSDECVDEIREIYLEIDSRAIDKRNWMRPETDSYIVVAYAFKPNAVIVILESIEIANVRRIVYELSADASPPRGSSLYDISDVFFDGSSRLTYQLFWKFVLAGIFFSHK